MRKNTLIALVLLFSLGLGNLFAQELSSKEAMGYFSQGVEAQRKGDAFQANVFYQKALLLDSKSKDLKKYIHNNYGVMYFKSGEAAKAEEFFNEALAIDQDYFPARVNLGFIYDLKRDELTAMKYWMKLFKIDLASVKPKDFIVEQLQMQQPAKKK